MKLITIKTILVICLIISSSYNQPPPRRPRSKNGTTGTSRTKVAAKPKRRFFELFKSFLSSSKSKVIKTLKAIAKKLKAFYNIVKDHVKRAMIGLGNVISNVKDKFLVGLNNVSDFISSKIWYLVVKNINTIDYVMFNAKEAIDAPINFIYLKLKGSVSNFFHYFKNRFLINDKACSENQVEIANDEENTEKLKVKEAKKEKEEAKEKFLLMSEEELLNSRHISLREKDENSKAILSGFISAALMSYFPSSIRLEFADKHFKAEFEYDKKKKLRIIENKLNKRKKFRRRETETEEEKEAIKKLESERIELKEQIREDEEFEKHKKDDEVKGKTRENMHKKADEAEEIESIYEEIINKTAEVCTEHMFPILKVPVENYVKFLYIDMKESIVNTISKLNKPYKDEIEFETIEKKEKEKDNTNATINAFNVLNMIHAKTNARDEEIIPSIFDALSVCAENLGYLIVENIKPLALEYLEQALLGFVDSIVTSLPVFTHIRSLFHTFFSIYCLWRIISIGFVLRTKSEHGELKESALFDLRFMGMLTYHSINSAITALLSIFHGDILAKYAKGIALIISIFKGLRKWMEKKDESS